MYEVEVKVPADLERVRGRLDELTAADRGSVRQVDTYYDAPHRSFPETDEALRVRRESIRDERRDDAGSAERMVGRVEETEEKTRLTYKGPLVDDESKTREEVETGVTDGEKMDAILTNLGFEAAATVRKDRDRYSIDGYTVTLDSVGGGRRVRRGRTRRRGGQRRSNPRRSVRPARPPGTESGGPGSHVLSRPAPRGVNRRQGEVELLTSIKPPELFSASYRTSDLVLSNND